MLSLIVVMLVIPLSLRWYSRRIERSAGDVADKVHRIRKATLAATLALLVLSVAVVAELYGEAWLVLGHRVSLPANGRVFASSAVYVLWVVLFAVAGMLYYLATYPVISRLRGLTASTGQAGRYHLRSAAVMLSPFAIWLVLRGFMNSLHGPAAESVSIR